MKLAVSGFTPQNPFIERLARYFSVEQVATTDDLAHYLLDQPLCSLPNLALIYADGASSFHSIRTIKNQPLLRGLIVVVITPDHSAEMFALAREMKVNDLFVLPFKEYQVVERLKFLVRFQLLKPSVEELIRSAGPFHIKLPPGKRLFDIAFASVFLLLLSPLLLFVALILRLESKGPVIHKSKRSGTGYRLFDFYKFRSTYPHIGNRVEVSLEHGQYQSLHSENAILTQEPLMTRVGAFIAKIGIDELPQLFNILKGDMSVVGNRPLPLYEAERLTSNEWSSRFATPAGLVGLWQVKKRATPMSEREKKKLENFYLEKSSIWFDLKILFGTVTNFLQKGKV